jgi:manganese/zinc/iron transport system substrate-binding protein
MILRLLCALACLALSPSSCTNNNSPPDSRPLVVATTTIVADMARVIGGDLIRVESLMGPGIDPHNYVPKISDTHLLEKADLILYNGLHLEGRLQSTLDAMAKRGAHAVAITSAIPTDSLLTPQGDFEGTKDPHVWGDPTLWAATIPTTVEALTKAYPAGSQDFLTRAETYRAELKELTAWAHSRFAGIPQEKRILVTSHDAFLYFGRAFGFEVHGLQGVSTAVEAGIKDRSNLVALLKERSVRTVFTESSINPKALAAVASEAGISLSTLPLYSDSLDAPGTTESSHGETYDKGTYIGMIKHNVNSIVQGLR